MKDRIAGWTALHAACVSGKVEAVRILVKHRANLNAHNLLKEKPIECVGGQSKGSAEIRRLVGVGKGSKNISSQQLQHTSAKNEGDDAGREKFDTTINSFAETKMDVHDIIDSDAKCDQ